MTNTPPRFTVYDRKVSDLTTFSAVNPRYWVIDSNTNRRVDEFSSKTAAKMSAREMNQAWAEAHRLDTAWRAAVDAVTYDPSGSLRLMEAEQVAYDALIDFVDANYLTYTEIDPRGTNTEEN